MRLEVLLQMGSLSLALAAVSGGFFGARPCCCARPARRQSAWEGRQQTRVNRTALADGVLAPPSAPQDEDPDEDSVASVQASLLAVLQTAGSTMQEPSTVRCGWARRASAARRCLCAHPAMHTCRN